jgi:transcription initiation factor TFIIIB Brf1 subunit/transcription initiation factor TFIIB
MADECPLCASRNVSFSEREHALVCRDCGTVIAGTPVALPQPEEEVVREILPELKIKSKLAKKPEAKAAKKTKKAKPAKKAKKVKKAAKRVSKKPAKKSIKKSLMKRLLRRR